MNTSIETESIDTENNDLSFAELTGYQEVSPTFNDLEISELNKPENNRTVPTLTNNPYSKMALVGGVGLLLFTVVGFVLTSMLSTPPSTISKPVVADNEKNILNLNSPDQRDIEIQKFKTDLALGNQTQPNLSLPQKTNNLPLVSDKLVAPTKSNLPNKLPTPSPAPQKISAAPLISSPPTVVNSPQVLPQRIFTTNRSIVVTPTPTPNSLPRDISSVPPVLVNPQEQWQTLANVGSYGTVPVDNTLSNPIVPQNPIAPQNPIVTTSLSPTRPTLSQNPFAIANRPTLSQNPFAVANRPTLAQNPFAIANRPTQNSITPISQPQNLVQDSAVSNTPINFPNNQPPKLLIGTTATASLKTPVVFSTLVSGSPKFIAVLDEPLLATDKSVVIPAGASLILTGQLLDPKSGLAELIVVSVSIDGVETIPPASAIVVRGSEGIPLIADNLTDSGQSLSADLSSFLLSGVTEATRVANNPTSTSFNSSLGGFSTSTVTPTPDIGNAALFGGFNFLTKTLTQRNEETRRTAATRPPIYYVPSGKRVQVFVNQTINL